MLKKGVVFGRSEKNISFFYINNSDYNNTHFYYGFIN